MLRIRLGYPSPTDEQRVLDQQKLTHPLDDLKEVLTVDELRSLQAAVREVYLDPSVADYIVRIVNATRTHPDVYLGASPRGSLALYRTGQALAALTGRDYVIPDDIKALAEAALAHRLIIKTSSSMHDIDPRQVIAEILNTIPVDEVRGSDRRGAAADLARPGTAQQGVTSPVRR
jgi:MoxR-like ATPase